MQSRAETEACLSAPRIAKRRRSFLRARDGSAAVEFSLIAMPFFFLMFAMIETAMIYVAQTSLDMAVSDAQRVLRTGEAQKSGMSQTQMRNLVCNRFQQFMPANCAASLWVDVDSFPDLGSVSATSPVRNGAVDPAQINYTPGGPESVVLIRAYYAWTIQTPLFNAMLANYGSNQRLLSSTTLMRVEPYPPT